MLTEKVEGLVEGRENDLSWQISELHERLKARWDAEFAQSLNPAHPWSQIQEKLEDEEREWEGSISVQTINTQHAEQRLAFGDKPIGPSPWRKKLPRSHIRGVVHLVLRAEDADVRLLDADGALVWLQAKLL